MRVLLVAYTQLHGDIPGYQLNDESALSPADELAEQAGRLCYLSWERPNPKTATNEGYLENIIHQQHFSVLEHASATFYIDGVSRNFTHELIRHRHLSFSEVSQRYVDVSNFEFVTPPDLKAYESERINDDTNEYEWTVADEIEGNFDTAKDSYSWLRRFLERKGLKKKEVAQAARHVLPGGLETKILVTGNMRAWREMLPKRLSPSADKEFQLVAQEILQNLRKIAPNTFQDFQLEAVKKHQNRELCKHGDMKLIPLEIK